MLARVAGDATLALSELDSALFPSSSATDGSMASPAMAGLLRAISCAANDPGFVPPRVRTHLFFRNVDGIWACADPACPEVAGQFRDPDRRVGQALVKTSAPVWVRVPSAEANVLPTCGDLFLGGFVAPSLGLGERLHDAERYLVAELGDLDTSPTAKSETCRDFTMYWPRPVPEEDLGAKRSWTREGYTFEFRPAVLDHATGRLAISKQGQTGWAFEVSDKGVDGSAIGRIPPLPIYCPQCGTDWEILKTPSV